MDLARPGKKGLSLEMDPVNNRVWTALSLFKRMFPPLFMSYRLLISNELCVSMKTGF